MTSMRRLDVRAVKMALPSPFAHAAGIRTEAENLVVLVETEDGVVGVGEGVPRSHVTGETLESAHAAVTTLDMTALQAVFEAATFAEAVRRVEALELTERLADGTTVRVAGAAACAVELAVLDALAKSRGISLAALAAALDLPHSLLGQPGRTHALNVTLGLTREIAWVRAMWPDQLPRHFKLKVGGDPVRDVERIRALRAALGPDVVLSVDSNMAWSFDQAVETIAQLTAYDIAWYEEPLARQSFAECRELRRRTGTKLMLDESVCNPSDLLAAIEAEACDLVNVKLSKCGGLIPSLRVAALAHQHGIAFQLGAMVGEMGVLAAAERQFATMVGELAAYDPPGLFRHSIVRGDLRVDHAAMTCSDLPGAGLGVSVNAAVVDRFTVRAASWQPAGGWTHQEPA